MKTTTRKTRSRKLEDVLDEITETTQRLSWLMDDLFRFRERGDHPTPAQMSQIDREMVGLAGHEALADRKTFSRS